MSEIRVLIVEDEPLIAEDIGEYLNSNDYTVSAIVHNRMDAIQSIQNDQPDIALLDINLGDNMDGLLIAEEINKSYNFPFLFLTSYTNKSIVEKAKYTRPMGYIVKPFDEGDLYTSIEIALYNHSQINKPRSFKRDLINEKMLNHLTEKEFEVLTDIYEGRTNKQMSDKHYVSINTIKTHIQKIYDKLDVHSRSETIAKIRSILT